MTQWHPVGTTADFPEDGGACAEVAGKQIAVFHFARRGKWYATDNLCPHKQQMALARGMLGSVCDESGKHIPKVACPFHKKTYSLEDGRCLSGDDYQIGVYPVKVENGAVFVAV
ncbi:nitrite reductase small subunit NirD [Uruburuella testudinis]|uniref:Nitrite reductase small subunit NirD n=1 Tax=Uruburuella testudinis TaxID=1282863 RepID=A0ABY4DP35_9NEIS|nr:nitrite reductase small subunit NirD [Uruburuella testudinis]UOO80823.1 nitrite reductase small subunit NirD [Uruburuella testudinis]